MGTHRAFVIHTRQVESAGSDFQFEITRDWLDDQLADSDVQPGSPGGTLQVNLAPISPGFWLTGTIHVRLRMQCLRCLRMTDLEMHQPMKVHMRPGAPSSQHIDESYGDDGSLGVGTYQGDEIVLDNLVRESIVLALPMSPRCATACSVDDLYRDDEE